MGITDLKIKNAKPNSKLYRLKDENGLYLEIRPSGKRVWGMLVCPDVFHIERSREKLESVPRTESQSGPEFALPFRDRNFCR